MAKDPAFLFYVNDWAGGTQWMTRLQRGAYLDLLLYQVNNTCFSLEELRVILGDDLEGCWPAIKSKFIEKDGVFFNQKMKKVLEARAAFTLSRRENRLGKKKKKGKKHKKNTSLTSVKLVGNGNKDTSLSSNTKSTVLSRAGRPHDVTEVVEYFKAQAIADPETNAEKFFNHYEAGGWMRGKTKIKDWKACVKTWQLPKMEPDKYANYRCK